MSQVPFLEGEEMKNQAKIKALEPVIELLVDAAADAAEEMQASDVKDNVMFILGTITGETCRQLSYEKEKV